MGRVAHALCKSKWGFWGERGSVTKGLGLLVSNGRVRAGMVPGSLTGQSVVLQATLTGKRNYLQRHTPLMERERVKANTNGRAVCTYTSVCNR